MSEVTNIKQAEETEQVVMLTGTEITFLLQAAQSVTIPGKAAHLASALMAKLESKLTDQPTDIEL